MSNKTRNQACNKKREPDYFDLGACFGPELHNYSYLQNPCFQANHEPYLDALRWIHEQRKQMEEKKRSSLENEIELYKRNKVLQAQFDQSSKEVEELKIRLAERESTVEELRCKLNDVTKKNNPKNNEVTRRITRSMLSRASRAANTSECKTKEGKSNMKQENLGPQTDDKIPASSDANVENSVQAAGTLNNNSDLFNNKNYCSSEPEPVREKIENCMLPQPPSPVPALLFPTQIDGEKCDENKMEATTTDEDTECEDIHESHESEAMIPTGNLGFQLYCDKCNQGFHRKETWKRHSDRCPQNTEGIFRCLVPGCGLKFERVRLLTDHLIGHCSNKPFKCTYDSCTAKFITEAQLTRHKEKHSNFGKYKCSKCPKTFMYQSHCFHHQTTHLIERPHKCEHCNKCFKSKRSLVTHSYIHLGSLIHRCKNCPKMYRYKNGLLRHAKKYHPAAESVS